MCGSGIKCFLKSWQQVENAEVINSILTTLCITLVVLIVATMILRSLVRFMEKLVKKTPEQLAVLIEQHIQNAPRWLRVSRIGVRALEIFILLGAAASALYALWIASHSYGPLTPAGATVFTMQHAVWWLSITFLLIMVCRPLLRATFGVAFALSWVKSQKL